MANNRLTIKQENYVRERLLGKSQREAYKAAYNAENMKDNSIDREACMLESNPKVAQRLWALQQEAAKGAVATAQEVLEELTSIAKGTKAYPGYTISGDTVDRYPSMSARLKALELIGKHHKLFTEKVEADTDATVTVIMGDAEKEYAE